MNIRPPNIARLQDGVLTSTVARCAPGDNVYDVKELFKYSVRINERQLRTNDTALTLAARHGAAELMNFLISRRADVNLYNAKGETPLMLVARNANVIKPAFVLVENDAKLDVRDSRGYTALMHAAEAGNKVLANFLMAAGADTSIKNRTGQTALDLAVQEGHPDIAAAITQSEAEVAAAQGKTPDAIALLRPTFTYDLRMMKVLLAAGVDVNAQSPVTSATALMVAVEENQKRAVQILLEAGADVNVQSPAGETALFIAARANNKILTRTLLKAGADYSITNNAGQTPKEAADALEHHDSAGEISMQEYSDKRAREQAFAAQRRLAATRRQDLKSRAVTFRPKPGGAS